MNLDRDPSARTPDETSYISALRAGTPTWWKALIAIVGSLIIVVVLALAVGAVIPAGDGGAVTPLSLLALNVATAMGIPAAMLVQRIVYGTRPGLLSSIRGRFRWRWALRSAIVVVPLWIGCLAILLGLAALTGGTVLGLRPGVPEWNVETIAFLAVVLATTPLQAAGEEYLTRGLAQRAVASLIRRPTVAFLVSSAVVALIFAIVHLSTDRWLLVYYVAVSLLLSVLARATGGLEAGVVVHAVGNTGLLALAVLTGQVSGATAGESGSAGWLVLLPIGVLVVMVVVLTRAALRGAAGPTETVGMPAGQR